MRRLFKNDSDRPTSLEAARVSTGISLSSVINCPRLASARPEFS